MRIPLGNGPVSWGIDFADQPGIPPWEEVFPQIAEAGYTWAELGPLGYVPEDPELVRRRFRAWGLQVAGSFVFEPLHDPAARSAIEDVVERTCRLIASMGGRFLVVIDRVSDERGATAGRPDDAPRLDEREFAELLATIDVVTDIAAARYGLTPVLHHHAGSYIEFADEIDRVLDAVPPERLGLCLDTGHAVYAGIDPAELFDRHRSRVRYVHLKDVDAVAHASVIDQRIPFFDALGHGVFCPLGRGVIDWYGLIDHLGRDGYDGPATVEQDRRPDQPGDPLEDAIESRRFLEGCGLVPAGR